MTATRPNSIAVDHQLLLTAALADESAAVDAWREWRAMVDFDEIDGPSQRLLPLIVRRANVVPADDPVRGRVRGMYRQTWVNNHRLWASVQPVLDQLAAADITVMALKGIALLRYYGGDWGVRPMYDIDMVVPYERRFDALEVLRSAGWSPETGQSKAWVTTRMSRHRHGWGHERANGQHRDRVDLHWRVSPLVMWPSAQQRWWQAARHVDIAGRSTLVIGPVDLLVHVLLHGNNDDLRPPVQWIVDSAMIARAIADDSDVLTTWAERAASFDVVGPLRAALHTAIEASGDDSLRRFVDALPQRRSFVDRLRTWRGPGMRYVGQLARASAAGAGLRRGLLASLQRVAEVDVVTHPRLAQLAELLGRPLWFARLHRRVWGVVSRPPVPVVSTVLPCSLDFSAHDTVDAHGGPGWRMVTDEGTRMQGGSASLVVVPSPGHVPGEVALTLYTSGATVDIEVIVDARRACRASIGATPKRLVVPVRRVTGDDGPLEIRIDWPRSSQALRLSTVEVSTVEISRA